MMGVPDGFTLSSLTASYSQNAVQSLSFGCYVTTVTCRYGCIHPAYDQPCVTGPVI